MSMKYKIRFGTVTAGIIVAVALLFNSSTTDKISGKETSGSLIENRKSVSKIDKTSTYTAEKISNEEKNVHFHPETEFILLDVPMSEKQQKEVFEISKEYGISYTLIIAVIEHESSFDASARSKTGDTGLMQINDCNKTMLRDLGFTDLTDPKQNIEAGAYILSKLAEQYEVSETLMAYNMGENNAKKLWDKGIYESVYSKEITDREAEFSQYIDNLVMKGE